MLERLEVPTLVMATRDEARPTGGELEAKRIAELIPDARLILFDDVHGGFDGRNVAIPPAVSAIQGLLLEASKSGSAGNGPAVAVAGLSPREVDVLRLIAAGKTNPQMADELVISRNTVQNHVASILSKAGLANRAEAAAYAQRRGLV